MNQTVVTDIQSGISIPERIEALLLLSQEMLAAADSQEWGRLAELEARRSLAISEFFAAPDCRQDTGMIRACIQRVLDLDGHVIARGEAGLRALAGEIANLGQGRRAHKAYGDVGDGLDGAR